MGTDIHPLVQRRKNENSEWEFVTIPGAAEKAWDKRDAEPILQGLTGRNYQLFAVLGNVRNGYGFAGVVTGEPIPFISDCRGLPSDFTEQKTVRFNKYASKWSDDEEEQMDYGDHSITWMTLAELLAYDWNRSIVKVGVISLKQFQQWDGITPPEIYSGGVWGQNIVTISEKDARESTIPKNVEVYVQISWRTSIKDRCKLFVEHVIPWLQTLGEPDNIRLIVGFDS